MPRNSLLPTSDHFRTNFPEFSDETRYPTSTIDFYLSMADTLLDQDKFGDQFVYLAQLMTAHYVEVSSKRSRTAALGGVNTSGGGVATSKSVDKVSVSYDVTGIINPDAGFWNNTDYGREFFWWWSMFGAGGRQIL